MTDAEERSAARPLSDAELVDAIPKHELHIHLEGAMPPDVVVDLVRRHGIDDLPGDLRGVRELYRYHDFDHFIVTYTRLLQTLRRRDDFELLARRVIAGLASQNVRYAEVTFTPVNHTMRGIALSEVFGGLEAGRLAAEEEAGVVVVRWITDVPGHLGSQGAEETLDAVLRLGGGAPPDTVVGFGLGGPEVDRRPFAGAFERARHHGLRSVPHAGEVTGPDSVRAAIRDLAAERVGHGLAAARDRGLLAEAVARGVVFDMCPTSNICTGVVREYSEHPLPAMLAAGALITINSDDPPMFGTSLRQEYLRCLTDLGLSRAELLRCAATAIDAGAAPAAVVQRSHADLKALQAAMPSS